MAFAPPPLAFSRSGAREAIARRTGSHELRDVSAVRCSARAAARIGGYQGGKPPAGVDPTPAGDRRGVLGQQRPGRRDRPAVEEVPGEHPHAHPPRHFRIDCSDRVLTTSALVAQPRRAVWTENVMFPSLSVECASVEQTICTPARSARRTAAAEVEARSRPVHLERDALLERDSVDVIEVEGVLRAAADQPARCVAEAAHVGIAQRRLHAPGHLLSRHALAAVHARLHPVELGQYVVGEVEPAVGEDVALDAAEDAERRQELVRGGDLLTLAADVVGRSPRTAPTAGVVADREVAVAAFLRGALHLGDARAAVRPGRMAMQVAADVARLDERAGGSPSGGSSRSSAATTRGRARRRRSPRPAPRAATPATRRRRARPWRAAARSRTAQAPPR